MPYLKESEIASRVQKNVINAFDQVKKADFILHNTVQELESPTLSALTRIQPNYAIGPINFSNNLGTNSLWSESDCTHWLESKRPGSVLYVSFGSLVQMSKQLIQEVAHALLLNDQINFIWVVRDNNDNFPRGFMGGIKDRGRIIPWCDQIGVLSNPAVGGFLTHCGWNSILESIWCGVPMICCPLAYDQPTNRKLVVDDWKIGISVRDGTRVDREEVAEKIKELMNGPDSKVLKQEVKKVGLILQNALDVNFGSSDQNFDQFVKDLRAKLLAVNIGEKAIIP